MPGKDEEYITFVNDDGSTEDWPVLGVFEAGEREYIALLDEQTEEVYLYRYIEPDEDSYDIEEIETDEEFEIAEKVWDEIVDSEEAEED